MKLGLFSFLDPLSFVVAFGIGLMVTYAIVPPAQIVIKFPTPYNAGKVVYKSENTKDCYVYEANEVPCPVMDNSNVRLQPI